MSQTQSGIINNLKGLAIDAAPRPPRVTIEDVEEDNSYPSSSLNSKNDSNNVSVSPRRKSKFKLPINIKRSKKKETNCSSDTFTKEKNTSPTSSPIFTQANRNVINIVNSKDIHWGPEIIYNFGSPTADSSPPSTDFTVKKTTSISTIMRSTEKVSHTYLDIISKNIGSGWRNIFRSMDFSDGMIELQYENHIHAGLSEVIYQILLDWVRNEDGSLGQLTTHLWNEGKRQLVKKLALSYQTEQLEKKEDDNLDENK